MTVRRRGVEAAVATPRHRAGGHRHRRLRAACRGGVLVGLALLGWGVWHADPPPAPLPARTFERALGAAPSGSGVERERPPAPPYRPDRLLIPSIGVDAPLVPEHLDAAGELVIPGDPNVVGAGDGGPGLGAAAGTTLLAGHVDVAGVGPGALVGLSDLAPGAWVVTTDAQARAWTWRVDSLIVTRKDDLPAFPPGGDRRLAIVTCGGPLLSTPSGNSYRDNVIAFAVPATR